MIRAQKVDTKQSGLQTQQATRPLQQGRQMEPDTEQIESIPQANTQLTAQIDGMVHTTRVEILTALVDTGTYQVDSQAIAQHILAKPLMRNLLKRV